MPFRDILKRQVGDLLRGASDQQSSLGDDLRNEFDRVLTDAIDPGRDAREAARQAAERERTRTQPGLGGMVEIAGIAGQWEAVELFHYDETSAAFTLVDRRSGETAQLSAVDDGTVILDSPADQHGGSFPGAFWRSATETGIRLARAELTADGTRRVWVTCDLRGELPPPDEDGETDYTG